MPHSALVIIIELL